jgi:hypothetical protein
MKNKLKEGLWIENYSEDSSHYKSIGKYRKEIRKNMELLLKW